MIDLKNLINMLPYTYKSRDTYKVNNEGLLERFLNILGYYLNDYIVPDIDNALDNINLDKTPGYYLNYFWEFLGELPFGYAFLIDKDLWDKYHEIEPSANIWEIHKSGPIILSTDKIRTLLKYSITLLKIRGTKKFYETLFNIYGLKCTITDPTTSKYIDDFNGVSYIPEGSIITPKFDEGLFDETHFDVQYINCTPCISVDIDISTLSESFNCKLGKPFADRLGIILYGKELSTVNLIKGIDDYLNGVETSDKGSIISLYNVLRIFFDKYLPFNVSVNHLTLMGVYINPIGFDIEYDIDVNYVDPSYKNIICDEQGYIIWARKEDSTTIESDNIDNLFINGTKVNVIINHLIKKHSL